MECRGKVQCSARVESQVPQEEIVLGLGLVRFLVWFLWEPRDWILVGRGEYQYFESKFLRNCVIRFFLLLTKASWHCCHINATKRFIEHLLYILGTMNAYLCAAVSTYLQLCVAEESFKKFMFTLKAFYFRFWWKPCLDHDYEQIV